MFETSCSATIMGWLVPAVIGATILLMIVTIIRTLLPSKKRSISYNRYYEQKQNNSSHLSYKKRPYLMTKNELAFYRALLPIAQSKNLTVFSKVRMADLLEPREKLNWRLAFNKIQSKHVDFVLCSKLSMEPVAVIELDDKSHQRTDRIRRDQFVDHAYESAGLPVIHTLDNVRLAEKIDEAIRPSSPSNIKRK